MFLGSDIKKQEVIKVQLKLYYGNIQPLFS